jgi:hypothetical protein
MNKLFCILIMIVLASGLIVGGCAKSPPVPTKVTVLSLTPTPTSSPTPAVIPAPAITLTPTPAFIPPPSTAPTPPPIPTLTPIPTPANSLSVAGTWNGSNNSSSGGMETVVFILEQSGVSFNGTWTTSRGTVGKVSGTLSGNTANFTINLNSAENIGSFVASGIVDDLQSSQPTMTFSYEGLLRGVKQSGSGKVQKQK